MNASSSSVTRGASPRATGNRPPAPTNRMATAPTTTSPSEGRSATARGGPPVAPSQAASPIASICSWYRLRMVTSVTCATSATSRWVFFSLQSSDAA